MKTLRTVAVVPEFVDFIPKEMEPNVIYISERFGVAVHSCLCGCGVKTVTPLRGVNGSSEWTLTKDEQGRISLTPSIANYQFPCKSHYIITKNKANFV